MTVATLLNVVARYAFNSPIMWAEEVSRYSFIWLVFIGAVVCTKHRRHICIDLVVMFLPGRIRLFAILLADVATVTLMLIMMYYGWILTSSANYRTSTLNMPTYLVYMVVPLSALLILFHSAKEFFVNLRAAFGGGVQR
jgi:TRAP-type C4-dicarboxylate transport system permease small subunit